MGDSEIGNSGSSLGTCFKQEEKSTACWEEATCKGRLARRSSLAIREAEPISSVVMVASCYAQHSRSIVGKSQAKSQAGWRVSRVTARLIGEREVEVEVGERINEVR